jgi:Zn-dependent M16 (insulinase) family peptidase
MKLTHGFRQIEHIPLPEYRAHGVWSRHEESGCELFHLRNDDPENLFAFAFKTLPSDSTGVAHILEHTVLCGSRRFPVKDPFIMLMRGSLNTFVNAMTYPDKTVYPASSTVAQDLFNIMQVYGDAVFFPLLRKEFFHQEGHYLRYNADGALDLSGIVYNEMKGNYATHDSLVADWSYRSLLPDTPYAHDAGGDPAEITNLTYEDFVGFHRSYYHPENARVFVYGNIPTDEYLDFLDRHFLSHFTRVGLAFEAPIQPRWSEPREHVVTCPADDEDGPTSVTVNWLLDPVDDPVRLLGTELLSEVLLGSSASPLRKRLIESGLGDELSASTGLESELREMIFSVGLRGTSTEKKAAIEELITDELARIVRDGLPANVVEGAFRKVEFRNREIKGGPNGLRMMGRSLRGWLHGAPPDATLRFQAPFEEVRKLASAGNRYFESMIEEKLLANNHRTTVVVRPDPAQQKREQARVDSWLRDTEKMMSPEEAETVRREQAELDALQQEPDPPQAVKAIPFLTVSDLPTRVETVPTVQHEFADGVTAYTHEVFANGIVYVDLAFDLAGLEPELLRYVPMFTDAFTEVGLPGRSYDQVATDITLQTGGIHAFADAELPVHEANISDRRIYVRLKCLPRTLPAALDLLRELLLRASLDNAGRLDELWRERRSEQSASVLPAGSSYVALRAMRAFSDAARHDEEWRGVNQLLFAHQDPEDLGARLMALRDGVIRQGNLTVNITAAEPELTDATRRVRELVTALPAGGWTGRTSGPPPAEYPAEEALIVPSGVSYVAAAVPASRFGTEEHVHELVLAHLLRTGFLWETVRMKGGAYGAGASARGMSAVFAFSSYRDPQIAPTLDAFSGGLESLAEREPDRSELELAVIGVTGHDIRPLSPGQKGMVALRRALYGVTDEMRQAKRDALLATGAGDVRRASERLHDSMSGARIVVMGGADALLTAAERFPGLTANRIVLPL